MRKNIATPIRTHEGAIATPITPYAQLRRSVLSCLLWENEFYEDGLEIAKRIVNTAALVEKDDVAALAIEARTVHGLRHVPMLLLLDLIRRGGPGVANVIAACLRRADEPGELISLFWAATGGNRRRMLPRQLRMGIARAMANFDEYALGKYNRAGDRVKLRDAIFLSHAKPVDREHARLYARLVNREFIPEKLREPLGLGENEVGIATPDTWEVALSGGADKREAFERLLGEGRLGYMALLRNVRNMVAAGVTQSVIEQAVLARKGARWVLPFRYVAAARAVPQLEPVIDKALLAAIGDAAKLPGRTLVLVDVSSSMDHKLSSKSDLTRFDAGAALGSLIHGDLRMFSFSDRLVEVPPRRGMAGIDALAKSQRHNGTQLIGAVHEAMAIPHDRMIVISDEQAASDARSLPAPAARGYMVNVASARNGIGYGKWVHLDGFSESILKFIAEFENDRGVPRIAEAQKLLAEPAADKAEAAE